MWAATPGVFRLPHARASKGFSDHLLHGFSHVLGLIFFGFFSTLRHSQGMSAMLGLTQKIARNETVCIFPICPLYLLKQCTGACEGTVFCPVWSSMGLVVCPMEGFGVILRCVVLNNMDQTFFTLLTVLWVPQCFSPSRPRWVPLHCCGEACCSGFHDSVLMKLNHRFPDVPPLPVGSGSLLAWLSSADLTYKYFSLAACCWAISHILGLWRCLSVGWWEIRKCSTVSGNT